VKIISRVFRGKFVEALRRAYGRGELDLAGATASLRDRAQSNAFVDTFFDTDWIVYAKPAFGVATAVLRYLGRPAKRDVLAVEGEQAVVADRHAMRVPRIMATAPIGAR
jgi:hypothetical protein